MPTGRQPTPLLTLLLAFLGLSFASPEAWSQSQREVKIITQLGKEEATRQAQAAASKAEAEHRAQLEEQTQLKRAYKDYLGAARRTAQALVNKKRKAASSTKVLQLRRHARAIIDSVNDQTKQRVKTELDKIYSQLEGLIAIEPEDLRKADRKLAAMHTRLSARKGIDLSWVEDTAILYALCEKKADTPAISGNIKHRENLSKDEAKAIDLCNRRRLVLGLSSLAIDMKLVACSRDHSQDMITHNFFAHESPVPGKTTPWDRAKNFGTTASGENIAAGYANGRAVTMGWWYSPAHLKNMMVAGHKRVAVGQVQKHYTQMFGN